MVAKLGLNLVNHRYWFATGFPEHMPFGEFRRRFDILAGNQFRNTGPVLDEKKVSSVTFILSSQMHP